MNTQAILESRGVTVVGDTTTLDYLKRVEETAVRLLEDKKEPEAVVLLLEASKLREQHFGFSSHEAWRVASQTIGLVNRLSLTMMREGKLTEAEHLLKQALVLESPRGFLSAEKERLRLRAITLCNYSSVYKAQGQYKDALIMLKRAVAIEERIDCAENPAATMLNMCVVCSHLNKHHDALNYAQESIILLREELETPEARPPPEGYPNVEALLAVAYHNMAVEMEHLGRIARCVSAFGRAYSLSLTHCGADHEITLMNKNAFEAASAMHAEAIQIDIPHGKPEKEARPVGHAKHRPMSARVARGRRSEPTHSGMLAMPAWRPTAASEARYAMGQQSRARFDVAHGRGVGRGVRPETFEIYGGHTKGRPRSSAIRGSRGSMPTPGPYGSTVMTNELGEMVNSPVAVDPGQLGRIMTRQAPLGSSMTTPGLVGGPAVREVLEQVDVTVDYSAPQLPFDKYLGVTQADVAAEKKKKSRKKRDDHHASTPVDEGARPSRPRRRHLE